MLHHVKSKFFGIFAVLLFCMALPSLAAAWVTVKGDDDRWMKFGAGFRSSFSTSNNTNGGCLLYTSPSPRDRTRSRMPSSA